MQNPTRLIQNNRLKCKFEKNNTVLFFSLVDYRNILFTSNEPEKILEFYNGFDNRDQLIQWMKERPKGVSYIHEVEGDKDIIVVIPTADFNGKYAKNCRENIFKGLHIIFVESGGKDDFYFNYAHNCNVGIKKAMEYNPKWVVVSNDDMYKVDDVTVLCNNLKVVRDDEQVVYALKGEYIVADWRIGKINSFGKLIHFMIPQKGKLGYYAFILDLRIKFRVKYVTLDSKITLRGWKELIYSKLNERIRISGVFNIFRAEYLLHKGTLLFDEIFINGAEDTDLYIKVCRERVITAVIDYRIGNLISKTMGQGKCRNLREIANHAYLNYKDFEDYGGSGA